MDDLRPPAAPGKKTKKEGFFTKLFKKDVDDVRITKDSLSNSKLEDIRNRIGIKSEEKDVQAKNEEHSAELPEIESDPAGELPVSRFNSETSFESEQREDSFELPDLESEQEINNLEKEHAKVFDDMKTEGSPEAPPSKAAPEAPVPKGLPESAPPAWNPGAEDARHKEVQKTSNWTQEKQSQTPSESSNWAKVAEPEEVPSGKGWDEPSVEASPQPEKASVEQSEETQATAAESISDWTQAPDEMPDETTHASDDNKQVSDGTEWSQEAQVPERNASDDSTDMFDDHFDSIKQEISQDKPQSPAHEPAQENSQEKPQSPAQEEHTQGAESDDGPSHAMTTEHHKIIDKALKEIEDKHKALDSQLEEITKSIRSDIPDWKFQRREVHPNKYFRLKSGQDVKSFKDLLEALSFIDEETFSHHVTENRNDFAEWVKSVLQEEKLAERIRNKKAREELLAILRDHEKKVIEELEENAKALGKADSKQSKKVKKVQELEEKIAKLQEQLEKKSEQLKDLRGKHGKEIKDHLDSHLEEELRTEKADLEEQKQELETKKESLEKKESSLWEQEQSLEKKEGELASLRAEQEKENEALDKKREQAEAMLHDAAEIKAMKEQADRTKAQTQQLIADNKQLQKEAAARDSDATKKLEKVDAELVKAQEEMKRARELQKELDAREREVKALETEAKSRYEKSFALEEKANKEKQDFEALRHEELQKLDAYRVEVEELVSELEHKTHTFKELSEEHNEHLERNEKVLEETEKLRNEIRDRQEAMESQSMQEYLRMKSENTYREDAAPSVDEIGNLHLYKLIDECKKAIEENNLKQARNAYNKLREEFGHSKLESHEKSVLYNSIRELYDDIHLAMLNQ